MEIRCATFLVRHEKGSSGDRRHSCTITTTPSEFFQTPYRNIPQVLLQRWKAPTDVAWIEPGNIRTLIFGRRYSSFSRRRLLGAWQKRRVIVNRKSSLFSEKQLAPSQQQSRVVVQCNIKTHIQGRNDISNRSISETAYVERQGRSTLCKRQ